MPTPPAGGTNQRLAREQCEKAFANYINVLKATPPTWYNPTPLTSPVDVPVLIRKGQFNVDGVYVLDKPDEIPLPALCLAVPRVKPHESMFYPICELHIMILSSIDEVTSTALSSARFGFIAELFDDSRVADVLTALNKPLAGTDNRQVKNFAVWGIVPAEDVGQEIDRRWIDHLILEVHCVPTDDVLGVGTEPT